MQRDTREALAEAIGEALEAVGVCEAQGFITHRSYCRLEELLREALNRVRPSALYSTFSQVYPGVSGPPSTPRHYCDA
jgi:hypothetical protein